MALEHYLKQPIFISKINDHFDLRRFSKITLLHLAVLTNNAKAVQTLLSVPNIDINVAANENTDRNYHHDFFYEEVTPLQLAIIEGHKDLFPLLLSQPQINLKVMSAYVINKHLINNIYINIIPFREAELHYLGLAFDPKWEEYLLIQRVKNFNLLHLAAKYDEVEIIDDLIEKGVSMDEKNSSEMTPLDLALYYEHSATAAKLKKANPSDYSASQKFFSNEILVETCLAEYKNSTHDQKPRTLEIDIQKIIERENLLTIQFKVSR